MTNQNQRIHFLLAFSLPIILFVAVYSSYSPAYAAITITVTGTADDSTVGNLNGNSTCDLREAILAANTNSTKGECVHDGSIGTDTINFNIPGAGPHTIMLSDTSSLSISEALVIDGTSQPGADCSSWPPTLKIILDGSHGNGNGLTITAGNSTIHGLVINQFNMAGIRLGGANNIVRCNFIGTDVNGTTALSNTRGIQIFTGSGNTIGGTTASQRNLISGNNESGIQIVISSGNVVQGNYIGTDINGMSDLGNGDDGILIQSFASNNTVGGSSGAGNLISGNNGNGVSLSTNVSNTTIRGNYIGTDVNGTADLGNSLDGIALSSSSNNIIGGTSAAARNIISGNNLNGLAIFSNSASNLVQGNYIGLQADGSSALGNSSNGILISSSASNNTIGGLSANTGNIIAYNTQSGVAVASGTGNAIDPNSIFSNGGLGIDLGNNGLTNNDTNDLDTGANKLQNFPLMTSATIDSSDRLVIEYSVDSTSANSTYPLRIEFFEADADGEGQIFIGSDSYATAQASQTITFSNASTLGVSVGDSLVSTATDASSNTSEFSAVIIPLVVELATFEATPQQAHILVRWQTTLELDSLGFNIWRSHDANTPQEQLNLVLIPSTAPGSGTGDSYEWLDETVEAGERYYYWLEEVDRAGNLTRYGPVSATASFPTAVNINQISVINGDSAAFWWAMLLIGGGFGIGIVRRRVL